MAKLVHRFLRHKGMKAIKQSLVVEVGFDKPGAPADGLEPGMPYVFEVLYDRQKVTAKLTHPLDANSGDQ
jgi:hypothetical protein